LLFIVYCIFEFFGGRAAELSGRIAGNGFFDNLLSSGKEYGKLASRMNKMFLLFSAAMFIIAFCIYIKNRKNEAKTKIIKLIKICLLSAVSLTVFYILAFTKAGYGFASRTESVYGAYFYGIMAVVLSFIYILSKYPKAFLVVPLIIVVLFIQMSRSSKPFSGGGYTDTTPYQRYVLMNNWINEIQQADREGRNEIVLKYPNVRIWFSDSLSEALYAHNITGKQMEIQFEKIEEASSALP
jgi:hypothetical protein